MCVFVWVRHVMRADLTSIIGLLILVLSLCFDSVLGNLQEKFQKGKICDEKELMYLQSVSSMALIGCYTSLTGEFLQGVSHCWRGITPHNRIS